MTNSTTAPLCRLCGSQRSEHLVTTRDFLLGRCETEAVFLRCENCGLIYQWPPPAVDGFEEHYPEDYDPYLDERAFRSRLARLSLNYGMARRRGFVERYVRGGRLLDVGCATGEFLAAMARTGRWEVYGLEPSPHASDIARKRYGLSIYEGTLEETRLPESYFDVVTMWDVLEHLPDPLMDLVRLRRALRPGGLLVVRVPNVESLDAKIFGGTWAGWDAPRHLFLFSRGTLDRLFRAAGFRPLAYSCASGANTTFLLSLRFWLVAKGVSERIWRGVTGLLGHPVIRLAMAPVFFVVSRTGLGPLLVGLATAPMEPSS